MVLRQAGWTGRFPWYDLVVCRLEVKVLEVVLVWGKNGSGRPVENRTTVVKGILEVARSLLLTRCSAQKYV